MTQEQLDQMWEPTALSRIGGGAQGGSTRTPREREEMNRKHPGRDDLDKPAGAVPPQEPAPPQEHTPQVHPRQEHPPQARPEDSDGAH
jgi:hypothetical protein